MVSPLHANVVYQAGTSVNALLRKRSRTAVGCGTDGDEHAVLVDLVRSLVMVEIDQPVASSCRLKPIHLVFQQILVNVQTGERCEFGDSGLQISASDVLNEEIFFGGIAFDVLSVLHETTVFLVES